MQRASQPLAITDLHHHQPSQPTVLQRRPKLPTGLHHQQSLHTSLLHHLQPSQPTRLPHQRLPSSSTARVPSHPGQGPAMPPLLSPSLGLAMHPSQNPAMRRSLSPAMHPSLSPAMHPSQSPAMHPNPGPKSLSPPMDLHPSLKRKATSPNHRSQAMGQDLSPRGSPGQPMEPQDPPTNSRALN